MLIPSVDNQFNIDRSKSMKRKILLLYVFVLTIVLTACNSYKNIPYYQNLDRSRVTEEAINNYSPFKIQPADILGITVTSLNDKTNSEFNPDIKIGGGNDNTANGYKVDPDGYITLPYVGKMKVLGLTTDEVEKQMEAGLLNVLTKPVVRVKVLNFKISVLGDVLKPDMYTVQNQHININEALSMAGDLNITAKRKNVLLIREQNGTRQYFPIDLTKKDLFDSPYYYLKNNDVLYVEPDRTKYDTVDRGYRTATLAISAISAAASIIVSIILLQKY
jgi:polysaccharide export outer membrane protein